MVSLRGGIANTVAYDLAKIEERWGLRPDQMLDYKSLKGDPTDNIPGIPGVGEKTASKLIATWGTLDALYEHIDEVMPEKLRVALEEHRESVLESRELMRLVRDVDVDAGPDARPGGGVRPPGGRPAVPRVRVPDADRPPAAPRRGAARGRDRRDARAPRSRVPGGPGRRARRGRSAGGGTGRPGGSSSCHGLRRRLGRWWRNGRGQWGRRRHRDDVAGRRGASRGARGRIRRRGGRAGCRDRGPRPHRARGHGPRGGAGTLAARAGLGRRGARRRRPTPARRDAVVARGRRRGRPGHRGGRCRGIDAPCGTSWRRWGRTSSATTSSRCSPRGSARTDRPRRPTSPSTPRSRPTSSTPRSGHRRSPTSSPSASTSSCPDGRRPAAHGHRGPRGPVRRRRPAVARAGLARRRRGPAVRGDRAAADPDPRPHGGGGDRP